MTIDGHPASSTNPATWSTYREVRRSRAGLGFGFICGDGIACFDIDDVLDGDRIAEWAWQFVATIPERVLFIERSVSGTGVHVFVESHAEHGYRRAGIEFYPRGRFIRVTGETLRLW